MKQTLIFALILLFTPHILSLDLCTVFTSGNSTYDLRPLKNLTAHAYWFYDNSTGTYYNYTLNVCGGIKKCAGQTNTTLCGKSLSGKEKSYGNITSLNATDYGILFYLSSSNTTSSKRNNSINYVYLFCDPYAYNLTLDSVETNTTSKHHNVTVAYARSRYACARQDPPKPKFAKICAQVVVNGGCYLNDCCYSSCDNGTECACFASFGHFNVTQDEEDFGQSLFNLQTGSCGYAIESEFLLVPRNNTYSGSTVLKASNFKIYAWANVTYYSSFFQLIN